MNDLTFAAASAQITDESKDCDGCSYPLLCARHVLAAVSARRARVATLLRG